MASTQPEQVRSRPTRELLDSLENIPPLLEYLFGKIRRVFEPEPRVSREQTKDYVDHYFYDQFFQQSEGAIQLAQDNHHALELILRLAYHFAERTDQLNDELSASKLFYSFIPLTNAKSSRVFHECARALKEASSQIDPLLRTQTDEIISAIRKCVAVNIATNFQHRIDANLDLYGDEDVDRQTIARIERMKRAGLLHLVRERRRGGANVHVDFVAPAGSLEKTAQVAQLFMATWDTFLTPMPSKHVLDLTKTTNVTVLMVDSDAKADLRSLRSWANMKSTHSLVLLNLSDGYLPDVVIHEAAHAVIGAYASYPGSSDFAEGCALFSSSRLVKQWFDRPAEDQPSQELIDKVAGQLEKSLGKESPTERSPSGGNEVRRALLSSTQMIDVGEEFQGDREYWKDELSYVVGLLVVEGLMGSEEIAEYRQQHPTVSDWQFLIQLNGLYSSAYDDFRRKGMSYSGIRQRDLLRKVIMNPKYLGLSREKFESILKQIREKCLSRSRKK